MRTTKLSIMLLCALFLAVFLYGCGASSKKEGTASGTPDTVASVGDTFCRQCHSAVVDPLTGVGIVAQYDNTSPHKDSPHANNGNGCEACHGGGAEHNGVGPIPYPDPFDGNGTRCASCHKDQYMTNAPTKFADSLHANVAIEENDPCRRCHTHEGAVLGATYGLTGPYEVMENPAYQGAVPLAKEYTAIKCATCHEHGGGLRAVKARDGAGNVVNWNPGESTFANNQMNLCTSCHNLKTYDGATVLASGTASSGTGTVGHHNTSWYRVIATTHSNNLDNVTADGISGYVIRANGEKPCFDCHGHEAKTNTSKVNPHVTSGTRVYNVANETIFTEWAKSSHAGGLLKAKVDAAGSASGTADQVATLVTTTVAPAPFLEDDWSAAGQQKCQRCHTATGASNYLSDPVNYDPANNDFSHLVGWGGHSGTKTSTQREMLYCWGCHKNTSGVNGVLRNPGAVTAGYKFNGASAQFPDVESSNVCIACHSGRESGESITSLPTASFNNVSFKNSHYTAAAGLMYVKIGFTSFIASSTTITVYDRDGNPQSSTYGATLTSTDDGGSISSTHRKFGTTAINGDSHNPSVFVPGFMDSGGPCVACHMSGKHHTLEMDASAFNNVCVNCHDEEGGVALTASNFKTIFIEEQAVPFQDALSVAKAQLAKYNITYDPVNHPYFYDDLLGLDVNGNPQQVKDWTRGGTVDGKKLMGACFNINLLMKEPAAYVHARTYTRRLIYDTIDFLDDKTINRSTIATAVSFDSVKYHAGTTANDATTTASMKYLKAYNRTGGAWYAVDRP